MVGTAVSMLSAMRPVTRVLIWGTMLILALLGLWIVLVLFKRRCGSGVSGPEEPGLSIEKLENLRSSGQISEEEFRVLRRAVLGLDAGEAKKGNLPLRPSGKDDDGDEGTGQADVPSGGNEEAPRP